MSEHKATLTWARGDSGFGYKDYPREHNWHFPESGHSVSASAAPQFLGKPDRVDPEEAYTAALASCHMLTFLAISSMGGYVIDRYEDDVVGYLAKAEDGKPWLSRVVMHPKILFSGEKQPTSEQIEQMHHKSHEECFLARSVKTDVVWESA